MSTENDFLKEAYEELIALSADDEKRLEYEARQKALRDYISQMESANNRGLRKGMEEGLQQGPQLDKKIFQLHLKVFSISEIALQCNLSEEEVSNILF